MKRMLLGIFCSILAGLLVACGEQGSKPSGAPGQQPEVQQQTAQPQEQQPAAQPTETPSEQH